MNRDTEKTIISQVRTRLRVFLAASIAPQLAAG